MFEIVVRITGDRAEAESFEGALLAADTLCHDYADALGTWGSLSAARDSVFIAENGTYAGIATAMAQLGIVT